MEAITKLMHGDVVREGEEEYDMLDGPVIELEEGLRC